MILHPIRLLCGRGLLNPHVIHTSLARLKAGNPRLGRTQILNQRRL